MDDDPKPKVKDTGKTYDNRLLDFFVSQSVNFKDNSQNKEWIMAQLKRASTFSMYLYLWSENLRQNGGTVEQAREAITSMQMKIYGVKEIVDGKEFNKDDLEKHRELREQPEGQSIGDFYDEMLKETKDHFSDLTIEEAAANRNVIITDLKVLRGVKDDIDNGRFENPSQLSGMLFNLASTDLRSQYFLDKGSVGGVEDKALGAQLGVAMAGNASVLGTQLKGREISIRVAAVERGKPLMPNDSAQIQQLKTDLSKFPH